MIAEPYIVYITGDIGFFTNIGYWLGFIIIVINIKKFGFI
jgi:hypothetical protein